MGPAHLSALKGHIILYISHSSLASWWLQAVSVVAIGDTNHISKRAVPIALSQSGTSFNVKVFIHSVEEVGVIGIGIRIY